MTIQQSYRHLIQQLQTIYEHREAQTIAQYIFEDAFQIKNTLSTSPFKFQPQLEKFIPRLIEAEPWQYVVGEADFYSLKFKVDSNVLIPRPETEELVYWIYQNHKKQLGLKILDIGTGSGCIPITLKHLMPTNHVSAIDISERALNIAKFNAKNIGVDVQFIQCDILNKTEQQRLDKYNIIVSNPPYIPLKEKALMEDNVLKHEPDLALFVENDSPLIFYETIADFALKHLNDDGYLYFEINEFLGNDVVALLEEREFQNIDLEQYMNGRDRMIKACK